MNHHNNELIEARQDEYPSEELAPPNEADSDGLELPPPFMAVSAMTMSPSPVESTSPWEPPEGPPGPKSMPRGKSDPASVRPSDDASPPPPPWDDASLPPPPPPHGPPPARLAPTPKIRSDASGPVASESTKPLEPKSPNDPPPGWVESKAKSDQAASDLQGKSDQAASDEGKGGKGKSDASSTEGKGKGKSDQGKSDEPAASASSTLHPTPVGPNDHRMSGYWSNLKVATGARIGGIPCAVMLLDGKLGSCIITAWVMNINESSIL